MSSSCEAPSHYCFHCDFSGEKEDTNSRSSRYGSRLTCCVHASQGMASWQVHKRDRVGLGLGWLEQAVEAATGSWKGSDPGLSSTAENVILLGLFGALSLVLWRRRNLRAAQQRAPNVGLSSCSAFPSLSLQKLLMQSLRRCERKAA